MSQPAQQQPGVKGSTMFNPPMVDGMMKAMIYERASGKNEGWSSTRTVPTRLTFLRIAD
jgi:hypothetical protein